MSAFAQFCPCATPQQAALVGERVPLACVAQRYGPSSPALAARLLSLDAMFPSARAVAGDGNCFFRAFLFALLEAVVARPDVQLLARCVSPRCCSGVCMLHQQPQRAN